MLYDDDLVAPVPLNRNINHREVAFRTYEHINNFIFGLLLDLA